MNMMTVNKKPLSYQGANYPSTINKGVTLCK